jgi:Spy/CpxP family protein refolding chaperone
VKKTFVAWVTLLIGVALGFSAYAYGPGHGMGHMWGSCYEGGYFGDEAKLNLSPEQKAKLHELRTAHLKDIKPLRDQMFIKHGDLRQQWLEKEPNQSKIIALQKEIQALRSQMQDKMTAYRFAVLKILTADQKSKLMSQWGRGPKGRNFGRNLQSDSRGCPGGGPGFND